MICPSHHLAVESMAGEPLCETCASALPVIQGRWCGKRCQRDAEQRALPTPTTIAARAAKIRAGWTPTEQRKRVVEKQEPVMAPVIAISDLIQLPAWGWES